MALPEHGITRDDILGRLDSFKERDVRWRDGHAFTLAYNAGEDVVALAEEAYRRFATENALNTDAFPSLRRLQTEVCGIVGDWLQAGPDGAGFLTTGGTESLLMAVKAARQRGRRERNVERPNIVLPTSAHAAFEKGCYYFGMESRRVPVRDDWRADADAMADAIDDDTVLVVGSAPQYPQGVVDPIADIAALAAERDINCHVDGCMGGVTLTYLARLGHDIPPWNFSVPGVTSISVDLHKYGYTAKGASVIMHRDKRLRADQTFVTDNWLGGVYGSSAVLGTKSGGAWAAAWAVLHYLGDEGYLRLTAAARAAAEELATAIEGIPQLSLRAQPQATLLAFGATDPEALDVFAVADALWRRGWYLDRQGPPASLHCTVNAVHQGKIPTFVADLRAAVAEVEAAHGQGAQGAYGTVE
ncbi:MAG: aspartate aminotransferase family protein [Acidimicrobiaceae bacterium]|nr:aspartate aminotransferase family protein [Ilumatobacter sp.]MCB9380076.1 aspartate aminotransferase family protein [Acidimicrobiaceae bacterium]MCO5330250.1 aminotransferase class V-fold PLP-dependent enzyme [Ilumatobacteraceae bacterium]